MAEALYSCTYRSNIKENQIGNMFKEKSRIRLNLRCGFFTMFLINYFSCASICGNNFLILSIMLFSRGLSADNKGSACSKYVLES